MTTHRNLSLDDVPYLIADGALADNQFVKAVSALRHEGFWTQWAIRALLALAAGHILSGIIFFFAFNWNDMPGMLKFSVVGGGILACLLGWVIAKLDHPMGQVLGIGATVLVGVMFAVLGQVYQTPAMIHTPFVFWAILTLPFALASRNLAHWTVWLVILTVAISSFANSGLRLAGDDAAANLLNLAVGGGFFAGLVLLDKIIAPRLKWARGEWFRVLLVLGAVGFGFWGFTESFWDSQGVYWLLALMLGAALVGYLYILKPSLPTLSLATFGMFTLVAQFGFKIFESSWDSVGAIFLVFIWLALLTVGLVALFRHFIAQFKTDGTSDLEAPTADENISPNGVPRARFAEQLGLDEAQINDSLARRSDKDQPWYMSVFLALAGFLTAILGCLFFGMLLNLIIGFDDEIIYGVLGLVIFIGSIFLRRTSQSEYVQHLLNTMIAIGGILTVFGFAAMVGSEDVAMLLIILLGAVVLVFVKDRILEFAAAAAMIAAIGAELYMMRLPMVETAVMIIATGLGIVFLSRAFAGRLYFAAGTAMLMAPAVFGIALAQDGIFASEQFSNAWLARAISVAVLLGAVFYLNRGRGEAEFKPPLIVLIPLVIGAALVPLGGAAALLLILTGYILGSRTLAIVGTLLQIYFLTMFYYDLSLGLLTKSILLFVSGLVFLGVYLVLRRHQEAAA